jgi:ATP-dependent Lhr-like helicase
MSEPASTSGFFRLHPNLQHALVHDLGWRSLRPVQELAVDAILDGCNTVVLAPTAGGKTEASIFPVLSRILTEEIPAVAALYVCPIRALLNNQEDRVQRYARMVGLDAFKWHGDVAATAKKRFLREPKHILMITPESLEVILIGQKDDARRIFAGLSALIIDEVHAFAGDDRGAHLMALLERLTHFCGRDVQRIGLSATVGNPDEIGAWLQGSSTRPYRRVDPPKAPTSRTFSVELMGESSSPATRAAALGVGKKSLVFVESRGQAERVAAAMGGRGVEVFVHHSAVSREDRERAEAQFTSGTNTAIVCTSTMELGIDVGDLDLVMQVNAPASVSSLLQRMGRTGRRAGTTSNCSFLCETPEALVQATAMVRMIERGFVEDVRPERDAAHILAHQIMALTLQENGVSRHRVREWIGGAAPFSTLTADDLQTLIDTMVERDILHEADGLLSLGLQGEKRFGRKNFFDLYAVFDAPSALRVMHGGQEVGVVQSLFVRSAFSKGAGACFRLGGRSWQIRDVDWGRGTCSVTPAASGRVPTWLGSPSFLSFAVCQEIKRVLAGDDEPAWLDAGAVAELRVLRESYDGLVGEGDAPLGDDGDAVRWYTFAGGAINRLLAIGLERAGGGEWTAGNWSLRAKTGRDVGRARDAVAALRGVDWGELATASTEDPALDEISKFQVCLPRPIERRLVAGRTFDAAGAGAFVGAHRMPAVG